MLSSNVAFVIGLCGVIGILTAITYFVCCRRRQVWRRFAQRHGLKFRMLEGKPSVSGVVDGRPFELFVSGRSSDTGLGGVEVVEMSVKLRESLPNGMFVEPISGSLLDPLTPNSHQRILTGDEEFDAAFRVVGTRGDEVQQFLAGHRRAALLQLNRACPAWVIELSNNSLNGWARGTGCRARKLDQVYTHLLKAAHLLDCDEMGNPLTIGEPVAEGRSDAPSFKFASSPLSSSSHNAKSVARG